MSWVFSLWKTEDKEPIRPFDIPDDTVIRIVLEQMWQGNQIEWEPTIRAFVFQFSNGEAIIRLFWRD